MKKILLTASLSLLLFTAQSQVPEDSLRVSEDSLRASEDSIAMEIFKKSELMEMFESLGSIPYFGDHYLCLDSSDMNVYGYDYGEIPVFDDDIYKQRIERLATQTTLPLVYNVQVRRFIELYAMKRRALTGRLLGLSHVYFPLFEEKLDKFNMPLELKYLAMIESALNPVAGSHAGAKGLWQFMYQTGKQYGLKSTTLVEERYDPLKATEAACMCMLDLYYRYKDWFLVLAAYNAGPGSVNKAIVRAGGVKNYWAIWPHLPRETQSYVPCFIAVCYVVNYAREHNLYPLDPGLLLTGTDTVVVRDILTFRQLNETIGVSMEDLRTFNPQYIKEIIPATDTTPYVLRMPSQYILKFVEKEKEVYAYKTKEDIDKEQLLKEASQIPETVTSKPNKNTKTKSSGTPSATYHVVKSGETLASIAKKYNTTVKSIKKLNNLKSDKITVKQKLRVS